MPAAVKTQRRNTRRADVRRQRLLRRVGRAGGRVDRPRSPGPAASGARSALDQAGQCRVPRRIGVHDRASLRSPSAERRHSSASGSVSRGMLAHRRCRRDRDRRRRLHRRDAARVLRCVCFDQLPLQTQDPRERARSGIAADETHRAAWNRTKRPSLRSAVEELKAAYAAGTLVVPPLAPPRRA